MQVQQRLRKPLQLHLAPLTGEMSAKAAIALVAPLHQVSKKPTPRIYTASQSLALLIDGDNASPKIVSGLLAEVANYGTASVKRVYGDWTKPALNGWKDCLLEHSLQPVQQFAYTSGKGATDGAMIIDAMDLLYTQRFSGFCIVSSDSDFTRLASRIREHGLMVYGFEERKTPRSFITACDKFVYFDVLKEIGHPTDAPANGSASQK